MNIKVFGIRMDGKEGEEKILDAIVMDCPSMEALERKLVEMDVVVLGMAEATEEDIAEARGE